MVEKFRRGSVLGRNLRGVWYTFGALLGGLKMMWSAASVLEGRKAGSGFTLRALRVRRKEDLWRQVLQIQVDEVGGMAEGRRAGVEKMEAITAADADVGASIA